MNATTIHRMALATLSGTLPCSTDDRQSPSVAPKFNTDALRKSLRAGVQGYYAFLLGKRVTYLGRNGDQHVEWFPGAEPTHETSRSRNQKGAQRNRISTRPSPDRHQICLCTRILLP